MSEKKIKVTCTFDSRGDAKKMVQQSFQIYLKRKLAILSDHRKEGKPVYKDDAD